MALFLGCGYGVYHIRIEVLLIGSALTGELFAPAFKRRNLAAKNLSRTTQDSGTVIVPLIPWSMAGVYMAGTLSGPTLHYAKLAFMCYLGIVFAIIDASIGLLWPQRSGMMRLFRGVDTYGIWPDDHVGRMESALW